LPGQLGEIGPKRLAQMLSFVFLWRKQIGAAPAGSLKLKKKPAGAGLEFKIAYLNRRGRGARVNFQICTRKKKVRLPNREKETFEKTKKTLSFFNGGK
jgi:hypothetical protein